MPKSNKKEKKVKKYARNIYKLRRTQGCMTDCVAYYFNLHPENVPYFVYPRKNWSLRFKKYFREKGYKIFWVKDNEVPKNGTYLVVGDSLKWKTASHMVVYKNGKCVYDPNYPSQWNDKRITHWLEIIKITSNK